MADIRFDGKVAIVTGAGGGLGRQHALDLARRGAKVVVNDLGGDRDGTGADASPAQQVVDEITAMGGEAAVNGADVSDFDATSQMIAQAVDTFGGLDVLVNNAGILRDRMLVNMTEEEWDAVIKVHLKGTFGVSRFAAAYWRERSKAGDPVDARVINTSSTSGLFGTAGQTNYGAAKTGIATLTIISQMELERYGVRVNAIAPAAATRLTATIPGAAERNEEREQLAFNPFEPGNVSPFVAYLATADCPIKGRVFFVVGGTVALFQPFSIVDRIDTDHRWTVDELREQAAHFADVPFNLNHPF